jgi:hypothetical protein
MDSGCREWQKARLQSGYGYIGVHRKVKYAHIQAYRLFRGPIPEGMCVLHTCDNPPCVNPDHLFLGTAADNSADRVAKGRQAKGESGGTARLREWQVVVILTSLANGTATRSELSRRFNVANTTIRKVATRETWAHVPFPIESLEYKPK